MKHTKYFYTIFTGLLFITLFLSLSIFAVGNAQTVENKTLCFWDNDTGTCEEVRNECRQGFVAANCNGFSESACPDRWISCDYDVFGNDENGNVATQTLEECTEACAELPDMMRVACIQDCRNQSGVELSSQTFKISNPLKADSIEEVLRAVASFLFVIAIPLTTIFILLGAFQLLTSTGNEEKVKRGKRTLTYAVVGFVVVFIAGGIATLIANILGS